MLLTTEYLDKMQAVAELTVYASIAEAMTAYYEATEQHDAAQRADECRYAASDLAYELYHELKEEEAAYVASDLVEMSDLY